MGNLGERGGGGGGITSQHVQMGGELSVTWAEAHGAAKAGCWVGQVTVRASDGEC
jgi:hypothetical protein